MFPRDAAGSRNEITSSCYLFGDACSVFSEFPHGVPARSAFGNFSTLFGSPRNAFSGIAASCSWCRHVPRSGATLFLAHNASKVPTACTEVLLTCLNFAACFRIRRCVSRVPQLSVVLRCALPGMLAESFGCLHSVSGNMFRVCPLRRLPDALVIGSFPPKWEFLVSESESFYKCNNNQVKVGRSLILPTQEPINFM